MGDELKRNLIRYVAAGSLALALLTLGGAYTVFRSYQADHAYERAEAATRGTSGLYELKAQQDAAEWAYSALWISLLGLALTGAGIVYVALTLSETRAATQTARDAVQTTRDIGQKQVRAYLSVGEARVEFVWVQIAELTTPNMHLYFKVRNSGQSPPRAMDLNVIVQVRRRAGAELLAQIPSAENYRSEPTVDIGAQAEEELELFLPYDLESLKLGSGVSLTDALRRQDVTLSFLAWVSGKDVFGDQLDPAYRGYTFHPPDCQISTFYPLERVTGRAIAE